MSGPRWDLAAWLQSPEFQSLYARSLEEHVQKAFERAEKAAEACEAGDCVYAKRECQPRPSERRPQAACLFRHTHGCDGYLGTKHIEKGKPLMRYGLCWRHKAWWAEERERIKARKTQKGGGGGKAPAGWE